MRFPYKVPGVGKNQNINRCGDIYLAIVELYQYNINFFPSFKEKLWRETTGQKLTISNNNISIESSVPIGMMLSIAFLSVIPQSNAA